MQKSMVAQARTRRNDPHLAPGLVNSITQPDNLVDQRHIRWYDEHVCFANQIFELLSDFFQLRFVDVCNCNPQS